MLKFLVGKTHSTLTLVSLVLNGGSFLQTMGNQFYPAGNDFFAGQYKNAKDLLINKLGDQTEAGIAFFENFHHWDQLKLQEETSLFSQEGLIHSGAAGLLELRFSESIFGQTTHFGVVVPLLKLVYGNAWATDGKVLIGLGAIAGLETAYWSLDCGQEEYYPEHT